MKRATVLVVVLCVFLGAVYWYAPDTMLKIFPTTRCLKENEKAVFEILQDRKAPRFERLANGKKGQLVEEGAPGLIRVSVVDTISSSTVWSSEDFKTPSTNVVRGNFMGKCNFYLPRAFNINYSQVTGEDGPKNVTYELWKLKYFSDSKNKVLTFSKNETGKFGEEILFYGSAFAINNPENLISLERSMLGKSDYALVIKNINTGKDEYVLTLDEVLKKHPNAAGSFDVGQWIERPDGEYLKTYIYDGSRTMAHIYVKAGTWETEIYETPTDMLPGTEGAVPPFAPLVAYTDVIVWAGFYEVTQALIEEQIASGQKKHLIVANLKTGKKEVIETIPIIRDHRFKMKWLSDTELQYTMPDGRVKMYKVPE